MKTWNWIAVMAVASGTLAWGDSSWTTNPVLARVRQLERDIPALYLLNGMKFSSCETAAMLQPLEEACKIEVDADRRIGEVLAKKPGSLEDFFVSRPLDKKPGALPRTLKGEIDGIRREARQKAGIQAERVLNILSDPRKLVLAGFVPCFIPPEVVKDPARADPMANDLSLAEAVLARLRTAAGKNERMATERALDVLVPYAIDKRHMVYTEESEQQVRSELARKLKNVIGMLTAFDEASFESEKSGMAADVVSAKRALDPGELRARVRQFLLNPGIYEVVKQRAGVKDGKSSEYVPAVAADLRLQELERTAGSTLTLRAIGLTRLQAERLLPIVEATVQARLKLQADLIQAIENAAEPYETLRKELAAGAPASATETVARECYNVIRKLREVSDLEAMLAGERKMDQELTAMQVAVLSGESQRLVKSGLAVKDEGVAASVEAATKCLNDLRWMKPPAYDAGKQKRASQFVADYIKLANFEDGVIDVEASVKRVLAVADDARALKDEEFGAKRGELVMDLQPRFDKGRPPVYIAKYVRGTPAPTVCVTTRALFSEEGLAGLKKLLGKK